MLLTWTVAAPPLKGVLPSIAVVPSGGYWVGGGQVTRYGVLAPGAPGPPSTSTPPTSATYGRALSAVSTVDAPAVTSMSPLISCARMKESALPVALAESCTVPLPTEETVVPAATPLISILSPT